MKDICSKTRQAVRVRIVPAWPRLWTTCAPRIASWCGSSTASAGHCLTSWKSLPRLEARQVGFRSLTEHMDTTTPHGAFLFSVFGALAQYERALARERIMAGLEAARKRGRRGGRPLAIDPEKLEAIRLALENGASKASVCRNFGVKRTTLYHALARQGM